MDRILMVVVSCESGPLNRRHWWWKRASSTVTELQPLQVDILSSRVLFNLDLISEEHNL
ncbi:unnamed protein product [Rhodiola kirilowii]